MSLRLKTIAGIAFIEAVLLIILFITARTYLHQSNESELQQRSEATATLLMIAAKDALLSLDLVALDDLAEEALHSAKHYGLMYVRILDAEGRIFSERTVADFTPPPFVQDNKFATVDDGVYDVLADITVDGTIYGRVELGFSTQPISAMLTESESLIGAIALFEMVLVAVFSFLLGTYLTAQLKALRKAARCITAGDFSHQMTVRGRDEIAEVAVTFNAMVDHLRQAELAHNNYEKRLKHLNAQLEDKVLERTAQLSAKNAELEAAHDELKTTQSQLLQSEKLASVGQLAAGVAHEINNPVSYIMSNLGTLQQYVKIYQRVLGQYESLSAMLQDAATDDLKTQLDQIVQVQVEEDIDFIQEDIAELLSDSIQGAEQVKDIVQGLKSFSRVDAPDLQWVDLNDCITSTLKMVNNELKYTCEVHTDLQALPATRCNPGQINQVLMNLLVNAGQAIDKSGAITVSSAVEGEAIVVRVADTGVGIAAADLSNIFTPFFTTKPVGEGTGLGLSISYGIMQEHGGSIEVDSDARVGTTFTLRLPVATVVTRRKALHREGAKNCTKEVAMMM